MICVSFHCDKREKSDQSDHLNEIFSETLSPCRKFLRAIGYERQVMDTPSVSQQRVTELLVRWSHGDDAALAELTPLVYEELRRLAHRQMGGQRPDHTLQTRRWSTRLICAWPTKPIRAGRTAPTSSP